MRIGILTYHYVPNFGANLQALATLNYLKLAGHEAEILNYRNPLLDEEYGNGRIPPAQLEAHEAFVRDRLTTSPVLTGDSDLIDYCNSRQFDAIILGSDAVLRFSKVGSTVFPNPYWLQWTNQLSSKPKLIGLALSSMGTNFLLQSTEVRKGIRKALASFDFISFRDAYTKINAIAAGTPLNRAHFCSDPVFALNHVLAQVEPAILNERPMLEDYVLISTKWKPPVEWVEKMRIRSNEQGLRLVSLPLPEHELEGPYDRIIRHPLDPLEWYQWIRHASGILCNRFHPTVCAFANSVPLASMDSYGRRYQPYRSKIFDLCWRFGRRDLSLRGDLRRSVPVDLVFEKWKSDANGSFKTVSNSFLTTFENYIATTVGPQPNRKRKEATPPSAVL